MSTTARHLMIRASAGTGKTFQLTNRYLRQLVDRTPPDEILATTFTRKAAGEILERVMQRLAAAASDVEKATELAGELGRTVLRPQDFQNALHTLSHDLHRLQVCTLDSFFGRLATSYTLELGLPPGWSIIDELLDEQLRQQAIETIIREEKTGDIQRLTNLLAKGDAGRSVTRLIRETVANFYEVFQQSSPVAWRQLPELRRLTNDELADAIDELEHVALPADKRFATARSKDLESAHEEDWESFIAGGMAKRVLEGETSYYKKEIPVAVIAAYQRLLTHARAEIIGELARQTEATRDLLERFDVLYRRLKHDERGVRFEDIPRRLREAFGQQGISHVAYRLDRDVSHLLLDEFQDTAPVQWDVLKPFAEQITSSDDGTSFFCVGDIKQAIYGWRGGVAELFDHLEQQLPQLEVEPLNQSFRSSQPVIDMVNRIFDGITMHPGLNDHEAAVRDWCDGFDQHTTAKASLPGYACVLSGASPRTEEEGPKDAVLRTAAERVAKIAAETPWASVGVLLRTHDEIAAVMNHLRQLGIPACEVGGNRVTDAAGVLVVMSLLQMADHPGDTVARFHVVNSPLADLWSFHDHEDGATATEVAADVRRSLVESGYGATIEAWANRLLPACSEREKLRLSQLVELAHRYDQVPTLRPRDFITSVESEKFVDPSPERVQVMTFHASKGLQFDVVVVPLVERNLTGNPSKFFIGRREPMAPIERVCLQRNESIHALLPPEMQADLQRSRENIVRETLCRLYVAVTRPVYALHVIVPPSTKNEKTLPLNPAGLVRAALQRDGWVEPDMLLAEEGNPRWFQPINAAKENERSDGDSATQTDDVPVTVQFAPMSEGRTRGLTRVAPSRHEERHLVKLSDILFGHNDQALNLGSLIHLWFEQIEWLDDGVPSMDTLSTLAQQRGFSWRLITEALPLFEDMVSKPALTKLLSRGRYVTSEGFPSEEIRSLSTQGDTWEPYVRREQSLAVRSGGELMTGAIDRLVLLEQGEKVVAGEVIDFKTDRIDFHDERAVRARVIHYREQLLSYREAVARTYALPPDCISLQLAFVRGGVVCLVS
ncbi:MAG: UvrD-helicase domain-containing protein [Planctomycetaceae bacterium]|nr:UvrD-helicase domain-containing protein [Planctomycetaceae bacterium]